MARQKGMLNLSGNLEPLAGAPLDSRSITPTVADLYIASNWPYKYIGMKTTVTATGDTYRLVNLDVTQESSWVKEGGASGQTIQYDEFPAASSSLAGKIYQYTGVTNLQYTNGYFYECVNDGGTYKWVQTNTQPGTSYSDFTGATSQEAGSHGLVPAPTTGDISKFLKGDGTWATVPMPTIGIGGGFAPIGTIISYMGTTAPQDYLICDGTTYNIADYKQLSDFFAAQFGSANFFGGDGVTTFKVPDLRGEFLRGSGTNSHTNQGSGANVGVHQDATSLRTDSLLKSNSTDIWNYVYLNGNTPDESLVDAKYTDKFESATLQTYARAKYTVQGTQTSGNVYRTTRPTNTSVLYCIKAVAAGDVYSTTERVVGTWIDGKPVYEKTFTLSNTTKGSDVSVDASNLNISECVEIFGTYNRLASNLTMTYMFNNFEGGDSPDFYYSMLRYDDTQKNIKYKIGLPGGGDATNKQVITIRYTKTTD